MVPPSGPFPALFSPRIENHIRIHVVPLVNVKYTVVFHIYTSVPSNPVSFCILRIGLLGLRFPASRSFSTMCSGSLLTSKERINFFVYAPIEKKTVVTRAYNDNDFSGSGSSNGLILLLSPHKDLSR